MIITYMRVVSRAIRHFRKSTIFFQLSIILLIAYAVYRLIGESGDCGCGDGSVREGFTQNDTFIVKENVGIYDDFYVSIYDDLMFNPVKNNYEIGEISRITKMEPNISRVLDIGSGTGHHCNLLQKKGIKCEGLEASKAMVKQSAKRFPKVPVHHGNALDTMIYPGNSFTHINCLYFTIYYIKNKKQFFDNCYHWLMPGGYLALHLVNRTKFSPIVDRADPVFMVNAQKHAPKRMTKSYVKFDDFAYRADFSLDKSGNKGEFTETIKHDDTGNVRKHIHTLYMEPQKEILKEAQSAGFNLLGNIHLDACQYYDQFIYILYKPE